MSQARWPGSPEGPFRLEHVPEGSRYELSDGHALYCAPAGPKHGEPHGIGPAVLGSDPARPRVGVDVGHALGDKTLRAPDVSVGDWGEGEGTWATKAPPLAIEYAAQGQDEADLQLKIKQLLAGGSRFVWVVRLVGPRQVEVYESGRAVQTKRPGERLEAPGILKGRPLVEALYDPEAASKHTLQNLLEREGYAGLDAVLAEGEARGRAEGLREGEARGEARGEAKGKAAALLTVLAARSLAVDDETRARIEGCADLACLERWLVRAVTVSSAREALDDKLPLGSWAIARRCKGPPRRRTEPNPRSSRRSRAASATSTARANRLARVAGSTAASTWRTISFRSPVVNVSKSSRTPSSRKS